MDGYKKPTIRFYSDGSVIYEPTNNASVMYKAFEMQRAIYKSIETDALGGDYKLTKRLSTPIGGRGSSKIPSIHLSTGVKHCICEYCKGTGLKDEVKTAVKCMACKGTGAIHE